MIYDIWIMIYCSQYKYATVGLTVHGLTTSLRWQIVVTYNPTYNWRGSTALPVSGVIHLYHPVVVRWVNKHEHYLLACGRIRPRRVEPASPMELTTRIKALEARPRLRFSPSSFYIMCSRILTVQREAPGFSLMSWHTSLVDPSSLSSWTRRCG